jgi:hypothetical protein
VGGVFSGLTEKNHLQREDGSGILIFWNYLEFQMLHFRFGL